MQDSVLTCVTIVLRLNIAISERRADGLLRVEVQPNKAVSLSRVEDLVITGTADETGVVTDNCRMVSCKPVNFSSAKTKSRFISEPASVPQAGLEPALPLLETGF